MARTEFDYIEERDSDLVRAYRDVMYEPTIIVNTQLDAIILAVNSESKRFWVSAEFAQRSISRIERGDMLEEMKEHRREMFMEIYKRYLTYRMNPKYCTLSTLCICTYIVEEKAPKFYLAPSSALKYYTAYVKRKWANIKTK
jgi:hypothetical protein